MVTFKKLVAFKQSNMMSGDESRPRTINSSSISVFMEKYKEVESKLFPPEPEI